MFDYIDDEAKYREEIAPIEKELNKVVNNITVLRQGKYKREDLSRLVANRDNLIEQLKDIKKSHMRKGEITLIKEDKNLLRTKEFTFHIVNIKPTLKISIYLHLQNIKFYILQ